MRCPKCKAMMYTPWVRVTGLKDEPLPFAWCRECEILYTFEPLAIGKAMIVDKKKPVPEVLREWRQS